MAKRVIKAHKGGRDKDIHVRCSQETLDQFTAILDRRCTDGQSMGMGDWIAEKVREEYASIKNETVH